MVRVVVLKKNELSITVILMLSGIGYGKWNKKKFIQSVDMQENFYSVFFLQYNSRASGCFPLQKRYK